MAVPASGSDLRRGAPSMLEGCTWSRSSVTPHNARLHRLQRFAGIMGSNVTGPRPTLQRWMQRLCSTRLC